MTTHTQRTLQAKTRQLSSGQCRIEAAGMGIFSAVNTLIPVKSTFPALLGDLTDAQIEQTVKSAMFSKAQLEERRKLLGQRTAETEELLRTALNAGSPVATFAQELDATRATIARIDAYLDRLEAIKECA
jgi:ubiquinone biosynthesis protein UbiJ